VGARSARTLAGSSARASVWLLRQATPPSRAVGLKRNLRPAPGAGLAALLPSSRFPDQAVLIVQLIRELTRLQYTDSNRLDECGMFAEHSGGAFVRIQNSDLESKLSAHYANRFDKVRIVGHQNCCVVAIAEPITKHARCKVDIRSLLLRFDDSHVPGPLRSMTRNGHKNFAGEKPAEHYAQVRQSA